MWLMIAAAWLISLIGVARFLAGTKRQGDAEQFDDAALERSLERLSDPGRMSGVYYAREAPEERSGNSNVA